MNPLETPMPDRLLGPYLTINTERGSRIEYFAVFEGDPQTNGLRARAWADKMQELMREAKEWEDEQSK